MLSNNPFIVSICLKHGWDPEKVSIRSEMEDGFDLMLVDKVPVARLLIDDTITAKSYYRKKYLLIKQKVD